MTEQLNATIPTNEQEYWWDIYNTSMDIGDLEMAEYARQKIAITLDADDYMLADEDLVQLD